jgi:hypothetical protein
MPASSADRAIAWHPHFRPKQVGGCLVPGSQKRTGYDEGSRFCRRLISDPSPACLGGRNSSNRCEDNVGGLGCVLLADFPLSRFQVNSPPKFADGQRHYAPVFLHFAPAKISSSRNSSMVLQQHRRS